MILRLAILHPWYLRKSRWCVAQITLHEDLGSGGEGSNLPLIRTVNHYNHHLLASEEHVPAQLLVGKVNASLFPHSGRLAQIAMGSYNYSLVLGNSTFWREI